MSYPVENLEPKLVWKYFDKIRQIPHGSKNEKALSEAVVSWAKELGLETDTDAENNVVIRIPASKGFEDAPTVVLQGHLDMVCEKNSDKVFDFEKDPIVLVRSDDDWISADGTTLGADNGIGVAMGLAMMEMPDAIHGPLEILCTTDEETGLNGANGLKPGFVKGKLLVNLDSEEDAVFYVGCAGGRDARVNLPLRREPTPDGAASLEVSIAGLRGGHSGLDIIQNRGNAVRLTARIAHNVGREMDLNLVSIDGGDKHNAIPREAKVVFTVPADRVDRAKEICADQFEGFRTEFVSGEPDLTMKVENGNLPARVLPGDLTKEAVYLLLALPHGVLAMSRDLEGLVETSSNMARVRTEEDAMKLLTASRSSNRSAVNGVIERIVAVGELAGADVDPGDGYPGWQPNMESKLLAFAKKVWMDKYGEEPRFTAIHAGLECGIIGEKYPGMDMISFGPTIQSPHSPEERVQISTVARTFEFTTTLLEAVAKGE